VFAVVVGGLACLWSPHQINPDATAYFTIAEKYARFDFHAINGYWGPLFSWLLVPFVWLGIGLDAAARGLSVVAAVAMIGLLYSFWRSRGLSRATSVSLCTVLAALFAGWVLLGATSPDMLFTFLVVLFAVRLDRFLVVSSVRSGVGLGCIGAAMYFAKGFGFYLFLAAALGIALWRWWQAGRRRAVRQIAPMFLSFVVLVAPFILVLSLKYHQPTINTTGSYVHLAFGPATQGGQPMLTSGPLAPPNSSATTVWEDPTLLLPLMPDWNPFGSRDNFSYFWNKTIVRNIDATLTALHDAGALIAAAAMLLALGCLVRGPGRTFRREFTLLASLSLVMVGGYALVLTEPRYLWPVIVLSLMSLGLWAARLEQKHLLNGAQAMIAGVFIAWLYSSPLPAKVQDAHLSATEFYTQAQALKPHLPPHAKVIADNFIEYNTCYYLQLRCYAVMRTPASGEADAYYRQLKDAGITYFVDYHSRDSDPGLQVFLREHFAKSDTVVTPHTHPLTPLSVTIYRLR
jgi:hypothetical protein